MEARLPDRIKDLQLGQRLQIGVDRATVRYIGQLDGQSGNWVGLEWDNSARGKHDGSAGGQKYFSCQFTECGGTFVRQPKLLQTARGGVTLLQGIRARYQDRQLKAAAPAVNGNGQLPNDATANGVSEQTPPGDRMPSDNGGSDKHDGFDLVGERDVRCHQGQLALLYKAALVGMPIANAGPEGQLAAVAPNLCELDLSSTLLATWNDSLAVMAALPTLEWLDLSHTRMDVPHHPGAYAKQQAWVRQQLAACTAGSPQQIVQHQAEDSGIRSPTEAAAAAAAAPAAGAAASAAVAEGNCQPRDWADDVHSAFADGTLPLESKLPKPLPDQRLAAQMRTLILNDCHVSWDQVLAIEAAVPALEELHLCDNGLTALEPPLLMCPVTAGSPAHMRLLFPRLKVLDLARNRLERWDEIRHVSMLPSLTALNVSSNGLPDLEQPFHSGSSFAKLRALVCGSNRVASWVTVDKLAQLPQLQELRLTGNPLGDPNPAATRSGVIARMPQLRLLNGSVVAEDERHDCELHFLRTLLAKAGRDDCQLAALQAEYPALEGLRAKYGHMAGIIPAQAGSGGDLAGADVQPPLSADLRRLCLVLLCGDGGGGGPDIFDERDGKSSNAASVGGRLNNAAFLGGTSYDEAADYGDDVSRCTVDVSGHQIKSMHRAVPGCINVGGLKFLVARLLGVPLHKQHLLIVAPPAAACAAPDSRHVRSLIDAKEVDTLHELGIEDGCDVRVMVKNAPWEEGQLEDDLAAIRALLQQPT